MHYIIIIFIFILYSSIRLYLAFFARRYYRCWEPH